MPAAWELKQSKQVLVCILHTDLTTIAWSLGLRNLIIPGDILPVAGMPYDMARNVGCKHALDNGYQWVFMLDSDVIPPRDAILRLMRHNLPFVSGVYCRRSPPHAIPVMLKNGVWITEYPANSIIEVDLVGSGCLLIHRSFLESIPHQRPGKPWFDWRVDLQGFLPREECLSEDFTLCQHAIKNGWKVNVDTSIQCRHVGSAQATYGKFEPLETTPNT